MDNTNLTPQQRMEIIHEFHSILISRDDLIAATIEVKHVDAPEAISAPYSGIMDLMSLAINVVTSDFFGDEAQEMITEKMSTDDQFRVYMLNTSTAFHSYLRLVHGATGLGVIRPLLAAISLTKDEVDVGSLEPQLYGPRLEADNDKNQILKALAGADFWMTCILLFIQTYHLNSRHVEALASTKAGIGGKTKR